MNTETQNEKAKRLYLKEKGKQLSLIIGKEEAKQLIDDLFKIYSDKPFDELVRFFETSHYQSVCSTAKAAMDREYYSQSMSKLRIISGIMILVLVVSILGSLIIGSSLS